jgi:cytochrome c
MKKISVLFLLAAWILTAAGAMASEELAKAKGCLNCHAIDAKRIGPAYKDVAKKYAGQANAEVKLANTVIQGGSGVWGNIPMPPNPRLSPEEAKQLVHWVLSLK